MNNDLDPAVVTGTSSEAAEKATGKPWADWMTLLDEAGGRSMNHKGLVAHLDQHYRVSAWWQQQIAVAYENSRGLRMKHEMADGYQISRSRTMASPAEVIYRAWIEEPTRRRWLPDIDFTLRKATPNKSIRLTLSDLTVVVVELAEKGIAKTTITVQQNKLPDAEAAGRMKLYWSEALKRLQGVVEE